MYLSFIHIINPSYQPIPIIIIFNSIMVIIFIILINVILIIISVNEKLLGRFCSLLLCWSEKLLNLLGSRSNLTFTIIICETPKIIPIPVLFMGSSWQLAELTFPFSAYVMSRHFQRESNVKLNVLSCSIRYCKKVLILRYCT